MSSIVNVLISTYNGEKYIKEQIDSILNQSYTNIEIYVRDDGSTDDTITILKEYEKSKKIHILESGINLGYGKSFLTLLEKIDNGDYWAFADQDDIWLPDKIKIGVEWLDNQNPNDPCLFYSTYYNTDENLNITEQVHLPQYKYNFIRSITECVHLGFSQMFNQSLRSLILMCNKQNLVTHDWWVELVSMKFAKVYCTDEPLTYHRRLQNSVSSHIFTNRFGWLKKAWKGNSEIRSCTKEFERVFGSNNTDKDYKINRWFCFDRYDFLKSMKKAFYWHRWRPSLSSEIVIRGLMLMGKI